jgi:hypothetical protein
MGVDWEVIIKSYRDYLEDTPYDHLSDYAEDFINYLAKFPYFTENQMLYYLASMCYDVFGDIKSAFIKDLHKEFDAKENIELSQINTVFNSTLKGIQEALKKSEDEKAIKLDSDFIDSNSKTINEIIEDVFEKFQVSKKQIAEITSILKLVFQKGEGWIDDYDFTGIVIAGYGEREIFPSIYQFKVGGKLGDSLIYFGKDTDTISTDRTSLIYPFAQTKMVYQFVLGIDDDFEDQLGEELKTILHKILPLTKDLGEEKETAIFKLWYDYIKEYQGKVFREPIHSIVASMHASELVSMAEAMVNLTALKRHVSTDEESVGGPIDVALITRGEGFIWIKRKTNYDPHINRHLNQKYFKGAEK